jgi:phosphatidylglycerophosphate synthase
MTLIGIILAPTADIANLAVAGLGLIERQARHMRRAGCQALLLVGAEPLTTVPQDVEPVSVAALPARLAEIGAREALVISPGLVLDERAIRATLSQSGPAMLVSSGILVPPPGMERLDAANVHAGLLKLSGARLLEIAHGIGDWDLGSTLIRTLAADATVTRVYIETLETYAPDRRRDVPMLWARPDSPEAARATAEAILGQAQKGCLDWPARFLHPPVENAIVRVLAPTRITPNMVTLAAALIGILAGWSLAHGHLWLGLGLALACGPLDGVDGKLARTRLEYSRWGDLEHVLDKILEYGWYLCAAYWFSLHQGPLAWALAALIILPAVTEAVQGEFFRRMTGAQLDDAGSFERQFRLVAGRRNTFLWSWLLFAAFGLWFEGYIMVAVYSVLTTAVAQWRFYVRLAEFARQGDARVAANYAATRYDFLPVAKAESERLPKARL